MKPVLVIGVAAVLCGSLPARAQTDDLLAASRPSASTGPTVPDTRPVDQAMLPAAPNVAPTRANSPNDYANRQTPDGFDVDPSNSNAAPGGRSVSASPAR
jgi:hypothetical protein